MTKAQRKARVKELKRREKLARRRDSGTGVDAAAELASESLPAETPETQAVPALVNRELGDDAVRYVREQASEKLAEARAVVAAAKAEYPQLDDDRARAMLVLAAEFLHEVVADTREALAQVTPEQRREALTIINEKPEPSDVSAKKRPRRGPNPVVSLMRVGMQAASLLKRILAKTNPEIGNLKRAA